MAHQPIGIEWQIGEEAYERGEADKRSALFWDGNVAHSPEIRLALHAVRLIVFVGISFFLVSGVGTSPQHEAVKWARQEVGIWLMAEKGARSLDDRDTYEALLDPDIASNMRRVWLADLSTDVTFGNQRTHQLASVSLNDGLIQTVVTANGPSPVWWRSSPYRESWFFRQGDAGLVRTVPPTGFWGERKTVETAHIRLDYYERDAYLAESIIPDIESAYLELFELLALDPDSAEPKITILIDKEQSRGWASAGRNHTLVSPYLAKIPASLSREDFMRQQIVSRISYMALNEALPNRNRTLLSNWERLIWSIDGWMRTDVLQQRSPWHLQAEDGLRGRPPEERPVKLHEIGSWRSSTSTNQQVMMRDYMIAESVVAFLVETYGREEIPRLLDGLTRYGGWPDLVNALYGLPVETLEAEWNQYLVNRFEWDERE